jgi:hypothetical protein
MTPFKKMLDAGDWMLEAIAFKKMDLPLLTPEETA